MASSSFLLQIKPSPCSRWVRRMFRLLKAVILANALVILMLLLLASASALASNTVANAAPQKPSSIAALSPNEHPPKSPLYAPGVLLSESFDGATFPPTNWGTTIVTGTTQGWSRVTSNLVPGASPHSGAGMAQFYSFFVGSGNSTRLYTPLLDFTGQTTPTLKFWMYHDPDWPSSDDRVQIQISTDSGTSYPTTLATISRYDGSTGWKRHSVDLSVYIGQSNVRIGLLAISADGNTVLIDDVAVGPPAPDYSTSTKSVYPQGVVFTGQTLTYTIALTNTGDLSGTATTLTDLIPRGTTYLPGSASVHGGGVLTATATSINWSGAVTENQNIKITFRVNVTGSSGLVINSAVIRDPLATGVVTKSAGFSIRVVSDTWSMQGYNAQHTSRSSAPGPITSTLRWTYDLAGTRLQDNASPVVGQDGTIYVPTETDFFAINPNGTLKWKKTYESGNSWVMRHAPALSPDGNVIYVVSSWLTHSVTALSTSNGNDLWQFPMSGQVSYSSFAVGSDGTIYIGTWSSSDLTLKPALYAIHPNGTLKWRYASPSGCSIETPPAVDLNGNVYFAQNCVGLVALDANGNLRWTDSRAGTSYGWPTPTIGPDGTIYIGKGSPALYAFNPNGTIKWQRNDIGEDGYFPGLAISADGATIYSARSGGQVYALKASNGATQWVRTITSSTETFGGSPALSSNGILYVMGDGNQVYAVSAFDGTLLWQYSLNSSAVYWGPQSPAIGLDGALYIVASGDLGYGGTTPARLYAFGSLGACPAIAISPASLPNGSARVAYSRTVTASGGITPYLFVQTGGIRPANFTFSTSGVLSGTPGASGSSTFTVTAADANGCTGSQTYTLTVSPVRDLALTPPTAAQSSYPGATVTYTLGLTNTGSDPDAYTLTIGSTVFTTTVTSSSVGPISAGASHTVTVTVQIPANAAQGAGDIAILTGTSQGDGNKSANSILTTSVGYYVYLPLMMK